MPITARRAAVAITAVAQLAGGPVIGFDPPEGPDPLITPHQRRSWRGRRSSRPASPTADQARPSRRDAVVLDEIAVPVAVVFAGFAVWLAAARAGQIWLTAAVFFVMLAGLLRALTTLMASDARLPGRTRTLAQTALGLYAGWAVVAVWANLASALVSSGADAGAPGRQVSILHLAGASAAAGALALGGQPAYVLTALWALPASRSARPSDARGLSALAAAAARWSAAPQSRRGVAAVAAGCSPGRSAAQEVQKANFSSSTLPRRSRSTRTTYGAERSASFGVVVEYWVWRARTRVTTGCPNSASDSANIGIQWRLMESGLTPSQVTQVRPPFAQMA